MKLLTRGRSHSTSRWLFAVYLICLITLLSGCSDDGSREDLTPAPGFTLKDLSGREVSLSHFRGKVVFLDFWASWCAPCLVSIPHLNALYEQYQKEGFEVLGINLDQGNTKALVSFTEAMGITYPILVGTPEVVRDYGVNPIPTGFLIDREGNLRLKIVGFSKEIHKRMSQEIQTLIRER
jgi:thiol-disulfide isomerase/thioredoxin